MLGAIFEVCRMNIGPGMVLRKALGPLGRNRWVRVLCAPYLYRRWVAQAEAILAIQKKEKDLDDSYWKGRLRQYAHMVDKGLHRGDFCKGHGTQAYGLARAALSHIRAPEGWEDPCVEWAAGKVEQYEKLQSGRLSGLKSEYVRTCCRYEDLLDAIRTRRSIRRYLDKPVGEEEIERITDVLDWSPTSCHRQPGRIYASNDPDVVRQCVGLHSGAACFTDIYAPLFLVFCADCRLYSMPTELAMPYIDVALGVQNCVLVAHTLGLSLTLLTWANHSDAQEHELREIFSIPPYFQIIVSAVGGYPDGGVQTPVRKNKELFLNGSPARVGKPIRGARGEEGSSA